MFILSAFLGQDLQDEQDFFPWGAEGRVAARLGGDGEAGGDQALADLSWVGAMV